MASADGRTVDGQPPPVRWPPLFSPVMATGIVSLAARGAGAHTLSDLLAWLAGALYLALLAYHLTTFARAPEARVAELRTSAIFDYLTFVAAGALLGGLVLRAGVGSWPGWVLLWLSGVSWLAIAIAIVLELAVLRVLHPRTQTQGGWLLAVVAPQALSVLALELVRGPPAGPLAATALVLWLLGSALYPAIALERLSRLGFGRQVAAGLRADDWILMGALAISVLAGSHLYSRLVPGSSLGGVRPFVLVVVSVQFVVACVLVPLLAWGESRHAATPPEARGPSGSRWATVFPLGMLAVASRSFAGPAGLPGLRTVSDILFVVALVAWLTAAVIAGAHRARDLHGRQDGLPRGTRGERL